MFFCHNSQDSQEEYLRSEGAIWLQEKKPFELQLKEQQGPTDCRMMLALG